MNLDTRAITFVGDGKSAESLASFWKRLGRRRHRIEAVAMAMSSDYISAVRGNPPRADIVFDRLHVVKLMNEKLTTLRRQVHREATADEKSVLIRGNLSRFFQTDSFLFDNQILRFFVHTDCTDLVLWLGIG